MLPNNEQWESPGFCSIIVQIGGKKHWIFGKLPPRQSPYVNHVRLRSFAPPGLDVDLGRGLVLVAAQ